MHSLGPDVYKQRIVGIMFIVLASFLVLLGRLFYLQVLQGQNYFKLSEVNSIRLEDVAPTRGLILDRHGELLVDNRPAFEVSIVLKEARSLMQTIEEMAQYLDTSPDEIMDKVKAKRGRQQYNPVLLKQDVDRNAVGAIEAHIYDLPGIHVNVRPTRHYVQKSLAAHLIGYLSEISQTELASEKYRGYRAGDFIGKVGIEKQFEPYLKGTRGGRQVEVNAVGQVVRVLKTVPAEPGHNIYLTIDASLQRVAESLLEGKAGAVLAMVPQTGEVLALASSPSYDSNVFVCGMTHECWQGLTANPFRPLENKAVDAVYPPASVYKIVTAMAGLGEGIIDENLTVTCTGGYPFGNRTFRCWKKWGHGKVDVYRAIAESCDVYFYEVGQQLGVDRLAWYASACGLGTPTGIELDSEAKGLVPTAAWKKRRTGESWQGGETLAIAIGQGYNLVTPLQTLVMTAAVANGGNLLKPLVVKEIKSAEEKVLFQSKPTQVGRLPASDSILDVIRKGLFKVVNERKGTAHIAHIDGIEVSGKTGTAQVVSRKGNQQAMDEDGRPLHLKAHAWFVAYAPSKSPEIAVTVIIEHGEHGSSAAAPIAREVIRHYLAPSEVLPVSDEENGSPGQGEQRTLH